ncbi:MAG: hypothetical protein IKC43_05955, partial [Clostridia bacterium]|nr:hypothetical protein [Clostridia bacterium]
SSPFRISQKVYHIHEKKSSFFTGSVKASQGNILSFSVDKKEKVWYTYILQIFLGGRHGRQSKK